MSEEIEEIEPIDPAVAAALNVWIARSAVGWVDTPQKHVQAIIDAARPIIEQQIRDEKSMIEPSMIEPFNWHETTRDSFMHWAVVSMIVDRHGGNAALNQVMQASDGATALKIVIEINGVRLAGVPFFERLWEEMQHQVALRATELIEDELTKLTDTLIEVDRIMNIAAIDVRRRFKELGLPMEEDDDA